MPKITIFTYPKYLKSMYQYIRVKTHFLYPESTDRFILSLDNHVSVMEALTDFCSKQRIKAGTISGLGAVNQATFRFLNPSTMKYVDKTFEEQMEITNLTGNISWKDGKPYLHVHITASREDYTCVGGHLLDARINGACELVVENFSLNEVGRKADEETGLNLYQL